MPDTTSTKGELWGFQIWITLDNPHRRFETILQVQYHRLWNESNLDKVKRYKKNTEKKAADNTTNRA